MKASLIFLFVIICVNSYCQESQYFTPYFQSRASVKTEYVREYDRLDSVFIVMDFENDIQTSVGKFYGFSSSEQIDEFITYYKFLKFPQFKTENNFPSSSAEVLHKYDNGKDKLYTILKNDSVKYVRVWNQNGRNILKNGSGNLTIQKRDENIEQTLIFQDFLLTSDFDLRLTKKDTIINLPDLFAEPASGFESFYKKISPKIKYPRHARKSGIEGQVYIQFIVDQNGKLTDFEAKSNLGLGFEDQVIEILKSEAHWAPARLKGKPVQTQFILPFTFRLN